MTKDSQLKPDDRVGVAGIHGPGNAYIGQYLVPNGAQVSWG
jgi:hypothetical protein